ncbi:hypothetical protein LCGC14_2931450, partial [marine sediment metagenome]
MKAYAGIGSRETPHDRRAIMLRIAYALRDGGWLLRSGGAVGADTAFARGAHPFGVSISVDKAPFHHLGLPQRAFEIAEDHHPAWHKCSGVARALLARNVVILLGIALDDPVTFVVYWHPENATRGGTLHAIRVAADNAIPAYNVDDIYDDLDVWLPEMERLVDARKRGDDVHVLWERAQNWRSQ